MNPFIYLISSLVSLVELALFVYVIISLLISFNILNRHQPLVSKVNYALGRLLEPLLTPIRRYLPDLGGLDISPIILIIFLRFIDYALVYYLG